MYMMRDNHKKYYLSISPFTCNGRDEEFFCTKLGMCRLERSSGFVTHAFTSLLYF